MLPCGVSASRCGRGVSCLFFRRFCNGFVTVLRHVHFLRAGDGFRVFFLGVFVASFFFFFFDLALNVF